MFWPIVLPFQITAIVLFLAVCLVTAIGVPRGWSRVRTLLVSSLGAIVLFVPSCTGVMLIADSIRFGEFHYESFGDITDFRSQRYLPEAATNIEMHNHANGYRARYEISADDFHLFLDELWATYGEHSAVERGGFSDERKTASAEQFDGIFEGLGWNCPMNAVVYHSPTEADGGGATYYFDADAGRMFQRTGFW